MVPASSDDVGSSDRIGEGSRNDEAQSHSFSSDNDSSSTDTSSESISGTESSYGPGYIEDAIISLKKDEFVKDGKLFCNRENCDKTFRINSKRTKHLRSHYKPVRCLSFGCGYRCAQRKEMDKHINSHHSEERLYYHCSLCPEKCTRQDNLRRHLNEKHGGRRRPR